MTRSGWRCVAKRWTPRRLKGLLGVGGALDREKLLVALSKESPHACVNKCTRQTRTLKTSWRVLSLQLAYITVTGDIHPPHCDGFIRPSAVVAGWVSIYCNCLILKAAIHRDGGETLLFTT